MSSFLVRNLIFIAIIGLAKCETDRPWYETLPAVAMDYKVHIDAGKEDCYFQFVNPGATFYVSFQVHGLLSVLRCITSWDNVILL